jgi:2-hydroxychromene-2-carboxylate isomerase
MHDPSLPKVILYFDFVSPYAYLAFTILHQWSQARKITLECRPAILSKLIAGSGNSSPGKVPAKLAWMSRDLVMQSNYYNIPFIFPKGKFPFSSKEYNEVIACINSDAERCAAISKIYSDIYGKGQILPVEQYNLGVSQKGGEEKVEAWTEAALKSGAFGVPWIVATKAKTHEEETFFGGDRLHLVERFLGL